MALLAPNGDHMLPYCRTKIAQVSSREVPPRVIPIAARTSLHLIFELLGYLVACLIYLHQRRRSGDIVRAESRSTVLAAAAVGGAFGGRLLALLENPAQFNWKHLVLLDGGKTIVGAILGGWVAVEVAKSYSGIHKRTGDLLVQPLLFGTMIGRIGCFLAGTADKTFGNPSHLPWAVDFGDGVLRHPLQLYEIAFLFAYFVLVEKGNLRFANGERFRLYVFSYFGLRIGLEALKSAPRFFALDTLQWAALIGILWCTPSVIAIVRRQVLTAEEKFA